jgi:hypothetical protein
MTTLTFTSPATGAMPVFTSRNDDLFGDKIMGVSGETDSNGDPTLHKAHPAIWIYYPTVNNTVQNCRIRWALSGIRLENHVTTPVQTVKNSIFENITGSGSTGVVAPS